ncbi:Rne/Rng family ribonuclease [Nostocoides sp. HKS02]|uniref:Rne/Rng family ribonuclease n=1 Tax=Nostocoides sp. HKS02 TaxID=1813880 RepID=UPI0012B49A64|nr:Rne/Rng family ribonuclease [Tetrasphaera sp. HKS02]QGN57751.1 Rne/Rng family ribonuclease [Tetrasphaera sp. HKS02]
MASTEDLFQSTETTATGDADAPREASVGDESTGGAPAPARKRARRATKKASAPAPVSAPTADDPTPEPTDAAASAPKVAEKKAAKKTAKKTARKAATKRASTKGATAPEAPVEEVDGVEATGEPNEPNEPNEPEASQQPPAVPSFGLLFQAPDVAAAAPARSARRATRKAAAPAGPAGERAAETAGEKPATREEPAAEPEDLETDHPTDDLDSDTSEAGRRRRRRGGKGRGRGRGGAEDSSGDAKDSSGGGQDASASGAEPQDRDAEGDDSGHGPDSEADSDFDGDGTSTRRRRRRRRGGSAAENDDPPGTVTKVREARRDEPQSVKGSTRLEAKKQRRREGREAGRRRTIITEAEFLARRESVERVMVVRERGGKTQIGVLEDGVLVEHYVSRETNASMAGNVYLGRVQNVLPSMEAAFVDIGKGRNAVLYAGEVNWDASGLENNQPKRIENALKSGDSVLVQVTKDPIGHKGARLTSQISLPGRYLVYVPEGSMTGISRKLPDTERSRLKGILKEVVPDSAGVIVRTAAEGASEDELRADVERLTKTWEKIAQKAESKSKAKGGAPVLVHGEPDLTVRVIRDVFNEDFTSLVVAGDQAYAEVSEYLGDVAPDLAERLQKWTSQEDLFTHHRVDEQIAKAMDRKVWLPSGGSLVIDRTEAMTVVDVNTGKFVGSGGNLEETVTKNNIEAAEEIVRQLRLRDIGGIIVIDFIDMVLESNRDLVVRRLLECLGRDRTKHQVAEVTSLGLVQMTRKRVGSGLIEVFSETCEHCGGRGIIVHADPVERSSGGDGGSGGGGANQGGTGQARTGRGRRGRAVASAAPAEPSAPAHGGPTPAQIAAAAHAAALKSTSDHHDDEHDEHGSIDSFGHADRYDGTDLDEATVTPVTAADTTSTPASSTPPVTPVTPADTTSTPASSTPKRRKRGRVVAPAGPPRPVTDGADTTPAEATSDAS